jgi:aminocarboxymuconate-semialdehyde decarboxylase
MTRPRTIDVHTHILTEEMIGLLAKEAPWVAPKLTPIDDDFAVLEVAGTPYRPFPRGGWELERRFKDMDAELKRAVNELGMRGAMIGSNIVGKNLDDPSLAPVWAAAEELGVFMIIHPANVAGADRLRSYYLQNLIGNPLDTTIAAACLVFGGVMERHPKLNVLLVHGGGFVPYQAGRWAHGWHVRPEPKTNVEKSPEPLIDRFYYDTILHAKPQLEFLVASAGAPHVLLGSDYPYDMGTGECVRQVDALWIDDSEKNAIWNGNVTNLLGL